MKSSPFIMSKIAGTAEIEYQKEKVLETIPNAIQDESSYILTETRSLLLY